MNVKRVLICGLGLIGGSLARALRAIGIEVYAVDIDANALALAEVNDWIHQGILLPKQNGLMLGYSEASISAIDAIRKVAVCCDMIILSAPLSECVKLLTIFAGHIPERVIITDIGSVKGPFLQKAKLILGKSVIQYVAAHPVAGGERDGVLASRQDLFENKTVVLCNFEHSSEKAYLLVSDMWRAIGSDIKVIDTLLHDRIFSAVSHFPHFLAFSSVNLENKGRFDDVDGFFLSQMKRHFRIASASAAIWSGIFLENRANLLSDLEVFKKLIETFRECLYDPDRKNLFLTKLRSMAICNHPFLTPSSDFNFRQKLLLPQVVFLPTIIVFCYLQGLVKHDDFELLNSFTGSGFEDFVSLKDNFYYFCDQDLVVNIDFLRLELASFLNNLAIFEELLVNKDGRGLSKRIATIAQFCRD